MGSYDGRWSGEGLNCSGVVDTNIKLHYYTGSVHGLYIDSTLGTSVERKKTFKEKLEEEIKLWHGNILNELET